MDIPYTLLSAVRQGDLAAVQGLLGNGTPLSLDPDSPHHSLFVAVIDQDNTVLLQSLLAACQHAGSSSSSVDKNSDSALEDLVKGYNTLLKRAVNSLSLESAKWLLACGAEIGSIQGIACFESIDTARQKKLTHLIKALVEEQADINGFSEEHGTEPFLCTSIRCENLPMVRFLLENGANPARVPSAGVCSPLHLVMKAKDPVFSTEALDALVLYGANMNAYASMSHMHLLVGKERCGELGAMLVDLMNGQRLEHYAFRATPLQAACLYSRESLLKRLIQAGADVNSQPTEEGFSALQIACLRGSVTLFNILTEAGAEVNVVAASRFGLTALQAATLGGHTDLATRLLDLGAHVNAPASSVVGLTALQAAAVTGDNWLVRRLLERGADVNAPASSETGKTALQEAIHAGNTDIVRILLEAGADANAKLCGAHDRA